MENIIIDKPETSCVKKKKKKKDDKVKIYPNFSKYQQMCHSLSRHLHHTRA